MTRDDIKHLAQQMGLKVENITDAFVAQLENKIENEKALLDIDTRRKVRKFWIFVSAFTFALGVMTSQFFL